MTMEMNKTISDVLERASITSSIFTGCSFADSITPDLIDFNIWFKDEYGDLIVKDKLVKNGELVSNAEIQARMKAYISMNRETLERKWEIVLSDYDPAVNYDKSSEIITSYEGTATNTTTNGTVTSTNGSRTDTAIDSTSLVDDESFNNKYKTTNTAGEQTNTMSKGNDSNTTSFDDRKDIVTEHTKGNIGVTMEGDILKNHLDFWSMFSFYIELSNVIIDALTEGIWKS